MIKLTKNIGLIIGRFQLVGNHHTDLFEQIVDYHFNNQKLDELDVGIRIADIVDHKNPFSGTERLQMIEPIVEKAVAEMGINVKYRLIPDTHNPPKYDAHVSEHFGFGENDNITVFSSNDYTNQCFIGRPNRKVVEIEERVKQHSSQIRELYIAGVNISSLVPNYIPGFLEKRNAKRRMEKLRYNNPMPTVDLIIEYNDGIVLIERAGIPKGYALPGGHMEYGESAETAALREVKEETGLDVQIKGLVGVYSDPARDPRGHRISITYWGVGYEKLKPGSDAKKAVVVYEKDIPKLAFDHNKILNDYFEMKNNMGEISISRAM